VEVAATQSLTGESSRREVDARSWHRLRINARWVAITSSALSLVASAVLALRHTNLGGSGDEVRYYAQAAKLLPFTDHYYGPSYFVALRVVHDITGLSWFASGRLISWLSACAVLLLCARLFDHVLPRGASYCALAVVALSPDFITQSYSPSTFMYGMAWLLLPILVLVTAKFAYRRPWLLAGVLFGIAALGRVQAAGFLLGAVLGFVFVRYPWRLRARAALLVVGGFLLPLAAWHVFLLLAQGFAPSNFNFVHLTFALGEFQSFHDVGTLIDKYGSMAGVLRADPANLPRIIAFAMRAALVFPFHEAPQLVGFAAGWIVPGVFFALADEKNRAPWFGALLMGLLLTGIGSRGWTFYYLPCLPLLAFAIATTIESVRGRLRPWAVNANWGVVLCSVLALSVVRVPSDFGSADWPEWTAVRAFLNSRHDAGMKVATTATSLEYGANFPVLDQDTIVSSADSTGFVSVLKRAGATHLVVTERHSLWDYPWMKPMLYGHSTTPGLVLDTLILRPSRVAVYRLTY
jgi:MFS family permease